MAIGANWERGTGAALVGDLALGYLLMQLFYALCPCSGSIADVPFPS